MLRWGFQGLFLFSALAHLEFASGVSLIRPLRVYENLIKGIHDYFNNTCIILLHGTAGSVESQEFEQLEGLLRLQKYLSGTLNIRTAIMNLETFEDRVGQTYYHIKRPLFVLLNDSEEVRKQFAHVSTWITMAYPTWLLFARNDTSLSHFFSNIYVPFDCILMITKVDSAGSGETIREVYQIDREDKLRWMMFGTWNAVRGFVGPRVGLYKRRNDLHGHNIRVASIHDPPVSLVRRGSGNEIIGIDGFFGEVIELLQQGMNCTFSYKEASTWGVKLSNGSWTGLMRMLLNNEADLAATEMLMTSDRMNAILFTTPVDSSKLRVYIKRPDYAAIKWDAYLAPFTTSIWNSILVLIIVSSGTIKIVKAAITGAPCSLADKAWPDSNISEITFHVHGAFCNQGIPHSSLDPVKMVQLVVHLTGVVVLAAYSAALISFLTFTTFVMPFTTMEGLLKDGTYRFGVVADSADYSFFQNTTDKILNVMFEDLLAKERDLPGSYFEGLTRVCEENKYSFMAIDNMATILQEIVPCNLVALDVISQTTLAMGISAGSPYQGIINSNILLLRDSGILQRLLSTDWTTKKSRAKTTWTSVAIEDVMPLLLFLLVAFFLTCLVLIAERLAHGKEVVRPILRTRRLTGTRTRTKTRTVTGAEAETNGEKKTGNGPTISFST